MHFERTLHMRYDRTDCVLMCVGERKGGSEGLEAFKKTFEDSYKREFGFVIPDRDIIVDDVR